MSRFEKGHSVLVLFRFSTHTLQVKHLQESIATVRDVLATYGGYLYRIDTFGVDDWARPVDTSSHIHRSFIVNDDDLGDAAVALQATFDAHDLNAKHLMPKGQAANVANAAFNEHYGNKENIPPGYLDQDTTKASTAASPIASSDGSMYPSTASSTRSPLGDRIEAVHFFNVDKVEDPPPLE